MLSCLPNRNFIIILYAQNEISPRESILVTFMIFHPLSISEVFRLAHYVFAFAINYFVFPSSMKATELLTKNTNIS